MRRFRPLVAATSRPLVAIPARYVIPAVVALGLVGLAGVAAAQAPAPAPSGAASAPPAVPGKEVCTISDDRLVELSGLVATADGYIAVNDGSDSERRRRIFFLDKKCEVVEAVSFPRRALDPEDLALSADRKTLWIADIGDNGADRETAAVWKMPADGSKQPDIFRLDYPDKPRDAEGLLVGRDGVPIIVTKGAKAELFKPTGALRKNETTPMKKVGELTLPRTSTSTPLGPLGRITVTGAASAPGGGRVVLRTYADAFEWDVPDGDIVAALTSGTPRITPLPDEPLGESITYSPDGATFLTVSETSQTENLQPTILRYTPAKERPPSPAAAGGSVAAKGDTRSWFDKLSLRDITYMIGGIGVLGLILVVLGVAGILRARRRGTPAPKTAAARPAEQRVGVASAAMSNAAYPQFDGPMAGTGYEVDGRRPGGVYGGGTYRSGQSADEFERDSGGPRTGGVYGRASGSPYPVADGGFEPNGGSVYGRGSAAPTDDWFANQHAGQYAPPGPEYVDPDPGYGYDDQERRGRF